MEVNWGAGKTSKRRSVWPGPRRRSRSKGLPDGEREVEFVLLEPKGGRKIYGWVEVPSRQMFTAHRFLTAASGQGARGFLGRGEDLCRCG